MMSSFYKTIKYLINPKSASISPKSWKPRPPEVELDTLLISWGLLSGKYRKDGTIESTKWAKFNQIFGILFLIHYGIKLIIAIMLNDNSVWIYYLGNCSVVLMTMFPRIYFEALMLSITIKSILVLFFYKKSKILVD